MPDAEVLRQQPVTGRQGFIQGLARRISARGRGRGDPARAGIHIVGVAAPVMTRGDIFQAADRHRRQFGENHLLREFRPAPEQMEIGQVGAPQRFKGRGRPGRRQMGGVQAQRTGGLTFGGRLTAKFFEKIVQ